VLGAAVQLRRQHVRYKLRPFVDIPRDAPERAPNGSAA
jgi:hypothetical protein